VIRLAQVPWNGAPQRVRVPLSRVGVPHVWPLRRVGLFGVQPYMGGKFHLKLNNGGSPIAYKYREGKVQRTLKRELKELEIAHREAVVASARRASAHARCAPWRGGGRGLMAPPPLRAGATRAALWRGAHQHRSDEREYGREEVTGFAQGETHGRNRTLERGILGWWWVLQG